MIARLVILAPDIFSDPGLGDKGYDVTWLSRISVSDQRFESAVEPGYQGRLRSGQQLAEVIC